MTETIHPRHEPTGSRRIAMRVISAGGVAAVTILIFHASVAADFNPTSPRVSYGLHFASFVCAVLSVSAIWLARRRGQSWDTELVPALFGGLAALTLLIVLHGTPFALMGISGDQAFRTAIITRFADTPWSVDYSYRGLPAYYAPAFFWVLGRAADLFAVEPWRMLKFGTVTIAFLIPIIAYVSWRRVLSPRTAVLVAATPLIVPIAYEPFAWSVYEPYAWIVEIAIVPWAIESLHGYVRPGVRRLHIVILGIIGAFLFMTYYYYFFLFIVSFTLYVVVGRWRGDVSWQQVRRGLGVLAISAGASAIYWAPLLWSFLTSPEFESLNNRWITAEHGEFALPMLQPSIVGALCALGLLYLLLTGGETLSRSLLIITIALYIWHAIGYIFVALGMPLMSFRMRTLIPIVLLVASCVAIVRLGCLAIKHLPIVALRRVGVLGGILFAFVAGDTYVNTILDHPGVEVARNQTMPNGQLPQAHSPDAIPVQPATAKLQAAISAGYSGTGHPVVLADQPSLFAFYPLFTFLQWNANYSHPAAAYHSRLKFLRDLSQITTPQEFATLSAHNRFEAIDVIVLRLEGDVLKFRTYDEAFPFGTTVVTLEFPMSIVAPEYFTIVRIDDYVVAVRKVRDGNVVPTSMN